MVLMLRRYGTCTVLCYFCYGVSTASQHNVKYSHRIILRTRILLCVLFTRRGEQRQKLALRSRWHHRDASCVAIIGRSTCRLVHVLFCQQHGTVTSSLCSTGKECVDAGMAGRSAVSGKWSERGDHGDAAMKANLFKSIKNLIISTI